MSWVGARYLGPAGSGMKPVRRLQWGRFVSAAERQPWTRAPQWNVEFSLASDTRLDDDGSDDL